MIQKYHFCDGGTIEFDNTRSVKELIAFAFDAFDYYEPMGMDVVTLFQPHHPSTETGWFTTDVSLSCAEEIKEPENLCFAYHLPNVFYFAEGGWGHHMSRIGNRPIIENEVSVTLRFENFNNSVIINGKYTFTDVLDFLKKTNYIDNHDKFVEVIPIGCADKSYKISFYDPIMMVCLSEFYEKLEDYNSEHIRFSCGDYITGIEFMIC